MNLRAEVIHNSFANKTIMHTMMIQMWFKSASRAEQLVQQDVTEVAVDLACQWLSVTRVGRKMLLLLLLLM